MSDEEPKLLSNKPKKSKLKPSVPMTTASSSSNGAAAAPPPPQPQNSFLRRYKLFGGVVLVFSFISGAYVIMRSSMQDQGTSEEGKNKRPAVSTSTPTVPAATPALASEKPVTIPIEEPIQRPPIPEAQQRELFKWMLDEKRKVKPRDAEEKKRIDEEKATLKQFIKAKSLPSI